METLHDEILAMWHNVPRRIDSKLVACTPIFFLPERYLGKGLHCSLVHSSSSSLFLLIFLIGAFPSTMDPPSPIHQDSKFSTPHTCFPKMPAIPRWLFPQRRRQDFEGARSSKRPRVRRRALFRKFSMTSAKDRNTTSTHSTESTYVGTASNPHSPPTTYPGILEYTTAEGLDEKGPVASNPPATQKPVDRSSFSDYPR